MSSLSNRRSSPGLTPIPWTSTTKNRRLTEVKETNAQNQVVLDETFQYDVNNNLIGEAVNGVPQRWTVYDGSTPYLDLTGAGQVSERYLADPNALAQYWARVGVTGQADWMVTDLLGSVRALVSAGGSVEDQIAYDAYGNVVSETNPSAGGRLKYAGGQYDGGLGLTLFGARWYNSVAGRWLSQDPLGLGPDMNPYRYVGNDPTDGTDPSGLCGRRCPCPLIIPYPQYPGQPLIPYPGESTPPPTEGSGERLSFYPPQTPAPPQFPVGQPMPELIPLFEEVRQFRPFGGFFVRLVGHLQLSVQQAQRNLQSVSNFLWQRFRHDGAGALVLGTFGRIINGARIVVYTVRTRTGRYFEIFVDYHTGQAVGGREVRPWFGFGFLTEW
jgi:RHS repeat-associated protein